MNQSNNYFPYSLIVSKWSSPVEAFTPHPKNTNPIVCCKRDDVKNHISMDLKKKVDNSEVIIAHETTKENAENILQNGFKLKDGESSCEIRDKAIFGWIHKSDIGKHSISKNKDYIVLFSVPKDKLFISSYNTSAKQIILGDITKQEYEYKHVLPYNRYEHILKNKHSIIEHLNYNKNTLLLD